MMSKKAITQITSKKFALSFILLFIMMLVLTSCRQEKVYEVGVLSGLEFLAPITDGFKAEMTELGYVEGENITYDVQVRDFNIEAYQTVLQQFVEDEVDLILVYPTEATIESKAITAGTGIPVVFNFAQIDGLGIVDSLREPGGNITGVRYPGPDIVLRRFEILREIAPDATEILVPYQKGYPIVNPQLEVLLPAAEKAGVNITEIPAENAAELHSLLQERAAAGNMDAILIIVEPLAVNADAYAVLSAFSEEHQLPMGGAWFTPEGFGSLFEVNANLPVAGAQAAPMADKILQGVQEVGSIPVVSMETSFILDLRQAEEMGLEVPDDLLFAADEILR